MYFKLSRLAILIGLAGNAFQFQNDPYEAYEETEEDYDDLACTTDQKTYSIKLYVHVEEFVIDAIRSASAAAVPDAEYITEKDAVSSYFGTIIDNFNDYLKPYKVEFDLDLNAYKVEEFMVTKGFDKSCEVVDPVPARTEQGHSYFMETYKGKIGLHLFVWGCPAERDGVTRKVLDSSGGGNCGKSVGVLWQNTDTTKDYIYSGLYEAIGDEPNLFLDGTIPSRDRSNRICQYADKCVVSEPSINGIIIFGNADFKNTIDYDDSRLPSELDRREITANDIENRSILDNDIAPAG
jgi:hypothetical protein